MNKPLDCQNVTLHGVSLTEAPVCVISIIWMNGPRSGRSIRVYIILQIVTARWEFSVMIPVFILLWFSFYLFIFLQLFVSLYVWILSFVIFLTTNLDYTWVFTQQGTINFYHRDLWCVIKQWSIRSTQMWFRVLLDASKKVCLCPRTSQFMLYLSTEIITWDYLSLEKKDDKVVKNFCNHYKSRIQTNNCSKTLSYLSRLIRAIPWHRLVVIAIHSTKKETFELFGCFSFITIFNCPC